MIGERSRKKSVRIPAGSNGANMTGENSGEIVEQPHGGALALHGRLSNRGGPGRPPNALRNGLRDLLEAQGLPRLEKIISDPKSKDRDVLRALELCLRYGVGIEKAAEGERTPLVVRIIGTDA